MKSKPSKQSSRIEREVIELEQQFEQAAAISDRTERDKLENEEDAIKQKVLLGHRDQLMAAPDRKYFLDSIRKLDAELERDEEEFERKERRKRWPKELQERESRRHEKEGWRSRLRVLESRALALKVQQAAEERRKKEAAETNQVDERTRSWNRKVIATELAKAEREPQSARKVERLNELKIAQAQNQDPAQPPPTITPSTNV